MRSIVDVSEHSVYLPALNAKSIVLDFGANHGAFATAISSLVPVTVICIEPNPTLASEVELKGFRCLRCAIGGGESQRPFYLGDNDQASSLLLPQSDQAHLRVVGDIPVKVVSIRRILETLGLPRVSLIKMDIEGGEIEALKGLTTSQKRFTDQWTVEFHDDEEFGLNARHEVDAVIADMCAAGFSVLIRNWPSRTNVLFVLRDQMRISKVRWGALIARYQMFGYIWRKARRGELL